MLSKSMSNWSDVPRYFCGKESYLSWFNLIKFTFLLKLGAIVAPLLLASPQDLFSKQS